MRGTTAFGMLKSRLEQLFSYEMDRSTQEIHAIWKMAAQGVGHKTSPRRLEQHAFSCNTHMFNQKGPESVDGVKHGFDKINECLKYVL